MKREMFIVVVVQLVLLCLTNIEALPNPKTGQWAVNSNLKSREAREAKDKEKDDKSKYSVRLTFHSFSYFYWLSFTVMTFFVLRNGTLLTCNNGLDVVVVITSLWHHFFLYIG